MSRLSIPDRVLEAMRLSQAYALAEASLPEAERVVQFCTVKELASLLRVSERTIRRLIRSGELPAYRLRGMIRICWRDVWRALQRV